MKRIREPKVAGVFYPGKAGELIRAVDAYLEGAGTAEKAKAVLSPHAGYVYSGSTAGQTFGCVEIPDTVIILGPKHRHGGASAAISAAKAWKFPFGEVSVDQELSERLADETLAEFDDIPHKDEHSLEVQIPFLWRRNPSVRIVGVALGFQPPEALARLGLGIAKILETCGKSVLLVASTDMSHHISEKEAMRLDNLALERVLALDPEGLFKVVVANNISMCGVIPTTAVLFAANSLGARGARLVKYTTSAEVTGDRAQVVGYAGAVIT